MSRWGRGLIAPATLTDADEGGHSRTETWRQNVRILEVGMCLMRSPEVVDGAHEDCCVVGLVYSRRRVELDGPATRWARLLPSKQEHEMQAYCWRTL